MEVEQSVSSYQSKKKITHTLAQELEELQFKVDNLENEVDELEDELEEMKNAKMIQRKELLYITSAMKPSDVDSWKKINQGKEQAKLLINKLVSLIKGVETPDEQHIQFFTKKTENIIMGVLNINWTFMGKDHYIQIREEFMGPIRRALGGRKDQKGRTQLPKQYQDLQMLYDLLIAVCNNGIAYSAFMNTKTRLEMKERELKSL